MSTTTASEVRVPAAGPGRLRQQLSELCRSGLEPHSAALAIAWGVTLGLLPLPWGTSLLCLLIAGLLGLNQPLVHLLNYLCYPLQIALYLPFCRLGIRCFAGDDFTIALPTDWQGLTAQAGDLAGGLWRANLYGIGAWLGCSLVLLPGAYLLARTGLHGGFNRNRK